MNDEEKEKGATPEARPVPPEVEADAATAETELNLAAPPVPAETTAEADAVTAGAISGAGTGTGELAGDPAALTRRLVVIFAALSLVMVLFHMQPSSRENANTGSRYATIEALVDFGTFNIDDSRYVFTPDKVKARGHFVSSKPPLLPVYGAGVYWLLQKATGVNILENEGIVVFVVGVATGWLGHFVFLIYFYRLAVLLLARQLAILLTMAVACFAYLGVAYATAINNHSPGATLAVVGFYHAFRARTGGGILRYLYAGFWLGLLPAIDLSSAALTGCTGLYLLSKDWKRTLLFFVPAVLPGMASQLLLAHAATGTWIPAYADASLMDYKGSYFGGKRAGIDALFEPKHVYAFHVLLGHHGLFSMTPLYFFSVYEIVRRIRKKGPFRAETWVFAGHVFMVCAFYIIRTHNYGGWCVGMRWFVPFMPWLVLLFGLWVDQARLGRVKWAFVVFFFTISAWHVQDGLTSPFQFSQWHNLLDDAPNRNRLGPTWNLSKKPGSDRKRPRPRPRPRPATPE